MAIDGSFTIFTVDLEHARDFWGERLGFTLEETGPTSFGAERGGFRVAVEGGARPRKRGRRWLAEAGVYVTLVVDDFDALVADLRERGLEFLDEVSATDEGGRITGFADPDGNLFELVERVGATKGA